MASKKAASELTQQLADPLWRLCNLYRITDKQGREVVFKPWPEQSQFLRELWFRNLILKARQRGYSTLIQLLMLDTCLFNDNVQAAVIAQDQDAANRIFRTKIKFAYDRLPGSIRRANPLRRDSASELLLDNGSSLHVSTSARSATLQWLHVSEFGKICARYPQKAQEIVTGSLPAVAPGGIICIESTAEGQEGPFYEMTQRARDLEASGRPLSKGDYKFHFASWYDADEYELDPDRVAVSPEDNAYFYRMEAETGTEITPEKRAWYVATRDNDFSGDRELMMREYPTTPDEAFAVSTEGCYLADQLTLARRQERITTVQWQPGIPVNTFWDIGHGGNDAVAIWLHQRVGMRDHFIGYIEGAGEPYVYYVRKLQELGYVWGTHYMPHDADRRFPGAEANPTVADMVRGLGLTDIIVVQRTPDLVAGIQQLRDDFVNYWFDEDACKEGLRHLSRYRKEWNDRLGYWRDQPRHDEHCHAADALRQKAQGFHAPSTMGSSSARRRRNRSPLAA